MIEAEKRSTRSSFNQSSNSAVADAVADLTENWPPPTRARCGDSILDTEFNEECDPPDGDVSCDDSCQTIP
ncbi:unnamed protein product [marine sediment metagenome]|uniref:Uncharacterized protein n=1 Tax=marine sediment metagenome TaxID=412755 RepID=X1CBU1_9ZZZZ